MKKFYFTPSTKTLAVEQTNPLLAGSPEDQKGSISGPDKGDDLDNPENDYKED